MNVQLTAILLAAGQSKRMGSNKQLLPLNGKPLIRHCLDPILAAGIQDIIIVLGPTGDAIEPILSPLPVSIVWNRARQSDMAESVRIGLRSIPEHVTGILVCLGDHPSVRKETIKAICASHYTHPEKIIIPTCNDRKGHPTLFPRAVLEEIATAATLRDIIHKDERRVVLLNICDAGIHTDIDTPLDFQRITTETSQAGVGS